MLWKNKRFNLAASILPWLALPTSLWTSIFFLERLEHIWLHIWIPLEDVNRIHNFDTYVILGSTFYLYSTLCHGGEMLITINWLILGTFCSTFWLAIDILVFDQGPHWPRSAWAKFHLTFKIVCLVSLFKHMCSILK